MPSYLLLLFSRDRRVRSVETVTAADLPAADDRARAILYSQGTALGYELWLAGKNLSSHFPPPRTHSREG